MNSLENYLNNTKLFKKYIDTDLKNLVREYLQNHYKDTYDSKEYLVQQALGKLTSILSNLSMDEIDSFTISTILRDRQEEHLKELILFIIYSHKRGFFSDSGFDRLCQLEDYIEASQITNEKFAYILTCSDYDSFLSSPLYSHLYEKDTFSAFCFQLNREKIKTDGIYPIIEQYIKDLKFGSNGNSSVLLQKLVSIDECCCYLFNNPELPTNLSEKALTLLDSIDSNFCKSKANIAFTELCRLIVHLTKNEVIKEPRLVQLGNVYPQLKLFSRKDFQRILTAENPERFFVYTVEKGVKTGQKSLVYIDTCAELSPVVLSFLIEYAHTDSETPFIFANFNHSLLTLNVDCIEDLTFETFIEQINYFRTFKKNKNMISALVAFYLYIQQNYLPELFQRSGIPDSILKRSDIGASLLAGFEIVVHNPLAPVPEVDKWLLCYFESQNSSIPKFKKLDFTSTECSVYREWIKNFIWNSDQKMETKTHPYTVWKNSFNYFYHLKNGQEKSIFMPAITDPSKITANESAAFRNWVFTEQKNNRTQNGYIYNVRTLLQFVAENNLGSIESGVFYNLTNTLDKEYLKCEPIPDEELEKLTAVIKSRAQSDNIAAIYYSIVYIALETELRIGSIINLKKDCVRETAKTGEYVLAVEEKTSSGELVSHPVTKYVVREIQEVIQRTSYYRQSCTDAPLTNILFIIPGVKNNSYQQVNAATFNAFLKSCCNEAGIKNYTANNLRYTHMTKAEEFKIRNSLSEIEQSVLSGHRSTKTDDIHYVRLDIREMLESVHGVLIGDNEIRGTVTDTIDNSIANSENEVSSGCGYCSSQECHDMSYLDCLMCKDFVTMPSRLPFFEERISLIDNQIQAAQIAHDKEDLANIKKLLVMYMEKLLSKEEEQLNAAE